MTLSAASVSGRQRVAAAVALLAAVLTVALAVVSVVTDFRRVWACSGASGSRWWRCRRAAVECDPGRGVATGPLEHVGRARSSLAITLGWAHLLWRAPPQIESSPPIAAAGRGSPATIEL
jgi:hypothetical protein